VRRIIAAAAKKYVKHRDRDAQREHRSADKRTQTLMRGTDQTSTSQGINSRKAHEMDGLIPILRQRTDEPGRLPKILFFSAALTLLK
jgi:hypothetical protein